MKIVSISFSGSNPSMGPHNVYSSNTLSMGSYQKELEHLLDNTTVNGVVTLREYLQFKKADNQAEIQKVVEAFGDDLNLRSGQRIIDLIFYFEDQTQIKIRDLRRWSMQGQGYSDFEALIREKGSVSQWSDNVGPLSKTKLKDKSRSTPEVSVEPPPKLIIEDSNED